MGRVFNIGDKVKLINVPQWLIHDLPSEEKEQILSYVGRVATVEKIDDAGYYWIGFGSTVELELQANYHGHSFCVQSENLVAA